VAKSVERRLIFLIFIFLSALAVRLYAGYWLEVINTDSTIYLYQAFAVSKGLLKEAKSCGYPFVSIYPIFISFFHIFIPDWITAGQAVNIVFGLLSLIPVYLLSRRFLSDTISLLVVLIFALNPLFVRENVDIMKDSSFWFFNATGIYLFVAGLDRKKNLYLFLSALSYSLGMLARIEGAVFFVASLLFLVFKRNNLKGLISFGFPIAFLIFIVGMSLFISKDGKSLWDIYFAPRLKTVFYIKNPFNNPLTETLKELDSQAIKNTPPGFFRYVKSHLWILAFGILITKTVSAFFYPFLLFFIAGLKDLKRRLKSKPLAGYLVFLILMSFLYLYLFTLFTWIMEKRYVASMIFPSFIIIGWGLENIFLYFKEKGIKEEFAIVLCLLLIFTTFFENFKVRRSDKLPYKEIGEFIRRDTNKRFVRIAGGNVWVKFYANYGDELVCPVPDLRYEDLNNVEDYEELIHLLKISGVDYFVWEENRLKDSLLLTLNLKQDLQKLGEWNVMEWKRKERKLVLFKVVNEN